MRLFAGIELPSEWHEALGCLRDSVVTASPEWRDAKWVAPGNPHVTLGFFGEVADSAVGELEQGLSEAVSIQASFALPLGDPITAVPSPHRAKMLWVTLQDPEGCAAELASNVQQAAAFVGVLPETRTYRPHITLARARRPMSLPVSEVETASCLQFLGGAPTLSVPQVTLFRSRLSKTGASYEKVATFHLHG